MNTEKQWIRVNRRRPCPICGATKWCLIARNGSAVICPRTPQGACCDLGAAGFLHRRDFFQAGQMEVKP